MKIAVSLTAHTSETTLLDQCFNYIYVGDVDMIVIHINPFAGFSVHLFGRMLYESPIKDKVFINTFVNYLAMTSTMVTPVDLHKAHISNFQYLRELETFDIFCTDASNCLLIREGLRAHLTINEAVAQQNPYPAWCWYPAVNADVATPFFGEDLRIGQHEGSAYRFETFEKVCKKTVAYERAWIEHFSLVGGTFVFPREEVIFQSAFQSTKPEKKPQPPYIFLRWDSDLIWNLDEVRALLTGEKSLSPHYFGIKKIERDITDPIRILIGRHFGYRQVISDLTKKLKDAQSLQIM